MSVKSFPVTSTGTTGLKHTLKGWYFSETGGTNPFTVTIRINDGAGIILWQHTIRASGSVGEDLADPIDLRAYPGATDVYVSITGTGVCQGAVRGH